MESFSLVPKTPVQQLIFPRAKPDPLTCPSVWDLIFCLLTCFLCVCVRVYAFVCVLLPCELIGGLSFPSKAGRNPQLGYRFQGVCVGSLSLSLSLALSLSRSLALSLSLVSLSLSLSSFFFFSLSLSLSLSLSRRFFFFSLSLSLSLSICLSLPMLLWGPRGCGRLGHAS